MVGRFCPEPNAHGDHVRLLMVKATVCEVRSPELSRVYTTLKLQGMKEFNIGKMNPKKVYTTLKLQGMKESDFTFASMKRGIYHPEITGYERNGYLNNNNGSLDTGANDLRLNGVKVMTGDTFQTICQEQMNVCSDVLFNKAKEYAQDNDRLHNFRSASGMTGDSMRAALAGMMLKHTISVYDMCRSEKQYPLALWTEKITDHINYLLLLKAVVVEELMSHEEPPEGEPYKEKQDGTEQET